MPESRKPATKKKLTTAEELQSLKVRMFEAEKQIDALNVALTVVAIAAKAHRRTLDKITAKQYEKYVFETLHPMIDKGNDFVLQLLQERGLLNESNE